eukprot:7197303-Ditylum_brightwellii.AAC.1
MSTQQWEYELSLSTFGLFLDSQSCSYRTQCNCDCSPWERSQSALGSVIPGLAHTMKNMGGRGMQTHFLNR